MWNASELTLMLAHSPFPFLRLAVCEGTGLTRCNDNMREIDLPFQLSDSPIQARHLSTKPSKHARRICLNGPASMEPEAQVHPDLRGFRAWHEKSRSRGVRGFKVRWLHPGSFPGGRLIRHRADTLQVIGAGQPMSADLPTSIKNPGPEVGIIMFPVSSCLSCVWLQHSTRI